MFGIAGMGPPAYGESVYTIILWVVEARLTRYVLALNLAIEAKGIEHVCFMDKILTTRHWLNNARIVRVKPNSRSLKKLTKYLWRFTSGFQMRLVFRHTMLS